MFFPEFTFAVEPSFDDNINPKTPHAIDSEIIEVFNQLDEF